MGVYHAPKQQYVWIKLDAVPVFHPGEDRPFEVFTLFDDVTGRKLAEEALRRSEEKYRQLIDTANSIILRWKPDGTIFFANRFALEYFGYAKEELIGHSVKSLVPSTDTGRKLTGLAEDIVKNAEKYKNYENENVKKNGERVWVLWTNKAILDGTGRHRGVPRGRQRYHADAGHSKTALGRRSKRRWPGRGRPRRGTGRCASCSITCRKAFLSPIFRGRSA